MRPLRSAKSCVTTPRYSSGASIADALDRLVDDAVDLAASRPAACRRSARSPRGASARRGSRAGARRGPAPPRCRAARSEGRAARRCRRARSRSRLSTSARRHLVARRPASGEVLMPIVIESDGSSTAITGSGRGSSGSASVSPIVTSGMPATAMISPGPGLLGLDPVERLGDVQLGHLRPLDRPVRAAPGDLLRRAGSSPGGRGRARADRRRARRRGS